MRASPDRRAASGRIQGPLPRPYFFLFLLALTTFRLAVAARAPLSADEAYYWTWSRALAADYPDHPFMVALWIRAGTEIAGATPLGVRLLGPPAALLGTWIVAGSAARLGGSRSAGIVAGALLNATLALAAGAVIMTPDTPLLLFWAVALAAFLRAAEGDGAWWLVAGAATGLAADSKFTAILPALGVVLWLVATRPGRTWLGRWQPWGGAALSLVMFTPVLCWNLAHGWAGLGRQGSRVDAWNPGRAVHFLAELAAGQIGLATPVVAMLFGLGLWRLARRGRSATPAESLLVCTVGVPLMVFLQHTLGDRVQANWPGVVYPAAAIAAAIAAPRFWRPATAVGVALGVIVGIQAAFAPLTLPRALDPLLVRLGGWSDLAGGVYAAALAHNARFVAADQYGLASELAWHLRSPTVISAEPRWTLLTLPPGPPAGQTGLLLRSLREAGMPDPARWDGAQRIGTMTRSRRGVVAERYSLWSVTTRGNAVMLPERK